MGDGNHLLSGQRLHLYLYMYQQRNHNFPVLISIFWHEFSINNRYRLNTPSLLDIVKFLYRHFEKQI